ncbi:D-methionine binding lipoprotein, ABC-type metal ion transporter [Ketogulonicigenium robustum]|uniref:D-methionine binding lipoprotein, ABC-type metal ion transporter n=2 Tax=Ketogulonicigenium robustum TaxID=92947 RepID=A0A1W6P124_9RHOB|nr:D-methionine binding lipoprotein, ABC-type metal ion transporter [Ketogulonicigenium robustum]
MAGAIVAGLIVAGGPAAALTIGVIPGMIADSIEAAAEVARAEGMDVEVVEFLDWTTPNVALDAGDLDMNYFQHLPFLGDVNTATGFTLQAIDIGVLSRLGLYSNRYDSLDAIPDGAQVGLASDPTNQGRGLRLLESAGLITLGKDGYDVTPDDVVGNPRNLRFVEVDGPQLIRAMDDLDLVQAYPSLLVNAGLPEKAVAPLVLSPADEDLFAMRFVTRADNTDDADVRRFIEIFHTADAVRAAVDAAYVGDANLYAFSWLNAAE